MTEQTSNQSSGTTWFVGASFGHTDDQSARFLEEGIWEISSPSQKEQALVRSMRPGERIAIKAAYVRKHGLPFDNRQQTVSVMGIKAIGVITDNPQDGERVKVQWQPADGVREWYFYTYRPTIWRVVPGEWNADALIEFAFNGKPQDIERFRNAPYWKDRFGTLFQWTDFYEAIAEKLLAYASNRVPLIQGIHQIAQRVQGLGYLQDKFPDGSSGPLQDICPFTVMGTFNRGMTDANRKLIAAELAQLLGVTVPVPATFEGIPVLNNQRSWFFRYADKRGAGDIDALWRVFAAAQTLVEDDGPGTRDEFIEAYDAATQVWGVAWNLSTGLYWAAPGSFRRWTASRGTTSRSAWAFRSPPQRRKRHVMRPRICNLPTTSVRGSRRKTTRCTASRSCRWHRGSSRMRRLRLKRTTSRRTCHTKTQAKNLQPKSSSLRPPSFPTRSPTSRVTAASCRSQSLSSYWTGCAPRKI